MVHDGAVTSQRTGSGGPLLLAAIVTLMTLIGGGVTNIFTGALSARWAWARDLRVWAVLFGISCVAMVALTVAQHGRTRPWPQSWTYGRRYRRWVVETANNLDTKGLITVGSTSPELEAVFIEVALISEAPTRVGGGLLADAAGDIRCGTS